MFKPPYLTKEDIYQKPLLKNGLAFFNTIIILIFPSAPLKYHRALGGTPMTSSPATLDAFKAPFTEEVISKIAVASRPLADFWANRIQWSENDHEDLVQEGLFYLVTTIRGYQKSGKEIRDLKAIASVCLSAAMKWWYKKVDRTIPLVNYEKQCLRIPVDHVEEYFSKIFLDEYLLALESTHGVIARKIAENLVSAGEEVSKTTLDFMAAKSLRRQQGEKVTGYAAADLSQRRKRQVFTRRMLNLEPKEWDRTLAAVQVFTEEYLENKKQLPHRWQRPPDESLKDRPLDPDISRFRIENRLSKQRKCQREEKQNGVIRSA